MRRKIEPEPEAPEEDLEYEAEADDRFVDDEYEAEGFDESEDQEEGTEFYDEESEVEQWPDEGGTEENKESALSKSLDSIALRAEAFWATVLAQARGVELPGAPDTDLKRAGTVAAIVLVSLAVAAGAYLLGKGSGTDVGQAELEGQVAGREAGAIEGASQGYPAGYRKGHTKGFRKAYVPAYRLYYKRAFEQAGLDAPSSKQIDVPLP